MKTVPERRIMVSIYVSIYVCIILPCVCRTLVPEIHVCPEMCILVY